jgi:tetratricopeptide (TPR) repeat protein
MIVKDDSEYDMLVKAITSIHPYVSGIYLTTTGKETTRIKTIRGVVHSHFDWVEDFAAARNFNFAQAPKDTDFLFWIDADDILVGGDQLQKLAQMSQKLGKDVIFLPYWYGCNFTGEPSLETLQDIDITQMRERLLRPGVTSWMGRLHETPVPTDGAKNVYSSVKYTDTPKQEGEFSIAVMHTAIPENLPEKMERNKRILELQLEDERKRPEGVDPRTLIYLMKIYSQMDDPELMRKCITMGEEYLTKSGWNEERAAAWENMGICYGELGDIKKAADCFMNAIREWPHQILFYLRLCTALYELKDYEAVKHWMNIAQHMDIDKRMTSGVTNFKGIKVMFAKLLVNMNYEAERDTKKALEAATLLYKEMPSEENRERLLFFQDLNDLNDACANVDKLSEYLMSIGEEKAIVKLLEDLPMAITANPFAHRIRQKVTPPRVWAGNEICYFANFGGKFFESWSAKALETGIGGSETAVIELAKEWTKLGYKVTVYGDPGIERGEHGGVTYLPWYEFNHKDFFNVFIQWRGWQLADQVKARKFLVDLHDIYSVVDLKPEQLRSIDKIMVKSEYQRNLAPSVPDEKFAVVSNGIRI